MESRGMARADLITAAVLIALGVAVVYGSWTMPRLEMRGIHPSSVPGLVPGVLGALLVVCGVLLGARSRGAGPAERSGGSNELWRLGVTTAIGLVYALGLVGWLPFWLATAVFVFVFVVVFEGPLGETKTDLRRSAVVALMLAVITGGAVSYIFQELFLVRLP
ncbi:tripartite tricarboxylate transporter TctB family protein [Arenibaculum sp.]|jgi:putative tricarboxylic transport membrane protein|uniref:tripartite tricarboxylate transporter TctB family protein n=1 Tax=Arenibaculum sp. TaxID=2865862 RepID=UPI002E160D45|nr:tripartite tricarboxylate transporter TctB family protein [Arenibaculum sp.]